jgi:RNA polymerase sigma factor (sigma-70 family)
VGLPGQGGVGPADERWAWCNRWLEDLVFWGVTPSEEADFTAFVRERGDALLRYARVLVPDSAEAEDVLQVALLRLLRHWSKRPRSSEAYVRSTLVNLCKDRARRRHLVPVPVPESSEPGREDAVRVPDLAEDLADAMSARARLDAVLGSLPPRQRVTVVLRVLEGLSEAEAAAVLGCSAGTVKSNLARGLAKARAVLDGRAGLDGGSTDDRTLTEGAPR